VSGGASAAARDLYAFTIPTGIGATIGGFAGDAGYIVREFAKHFDLIVNPNAVNGGVLSAISDNMHYVEGWALDEFLCGNIGLEPAGSRARKIGVIFDSSLPQNILNIHINTLNACKMVRGLDILGYEITTKPAQVSFEIKNNISSGGLKNPETLLDAGKKLLAKGADVLAVVCFFPEASEADDTNYCAGEGIDPIGGVEGVISHFISSELGVISAHAPAFANLEISEKIENEKVAAEFISSTYLPCVLAGLNRAPRILHASRAAAAGKGLPLPKGLIVPATALGSKGVLGAVKNNIPIFSVENPSCIEVCASKLNIPVTYFKNYNACLETLLSSK